MKTLVLFVLGISGIALILLGTSFLVGGSAFADISFDSESETQWYNANNNKATVSASANPLPLPVGISVVIQQTIHSH